MIEFVASLPVRSLALLAAVVSALTPNAPTAPAPLAAVVALGASAGEGRGGLVVDCFGGECCFSPLHQPMASPFQ